MPKLQQGKHKWYMGFFCKVKNKAVSHRKTNKAKIKRYCRNACNANTGCWRNVSSLLSSLKLYYCQMLMWVHLQGWHTSVVSLSNWPTSLPTALVAAPRWQSKTIAATEFHCISLWEWWVWGVGGIRWYMYTRNNNQFDPVRLGLLCTSVWVRHIKQGHWMCFAWEHQRLASGFSTNIWGFYA